MRVALIGGLDRLRRHYQDAARRLGVELEVYNRAEANLAARLQGSQALVVFTGNLSHQARVLVFAFARSRLIPVQQSHSGGVAALRRCLDTLRAGTPRPPRRAS